MTAQAWQIIAQWAVIIGGILTLAGGTGTWYFGSKAMDEKLNTILNEVQSVPVRTQMQKDMSDTRKRLMEKRKQSAAQHRAVKR